MLFHCSISLIYGIFKSVSLLAVFLRHIRININVCTAILLAHFAGVFIVAVLGIIYSLAQICLLSAVRSYLSIPLFSPLLVSVALYLVNHKHTLSVRVSGLAKAHPRHSPATASLAKMHLVMLVPRLDCRHGQDDFSLVVKPLCGVP